MTLGLRRDPLLLTVVTVTGLAAASARAETLQVGPTRALTTPSAAAAIAQDGDVIEIDAGEYVGDVATFTADDLTIRGVGGLAHLRANGNSAGGKAIWVIQGARTTIERIEFSEASVPDQNGAGIRQEGAGLTVRGCFFHDNENGILAGANADSDIVVESTELARNGYGDGYSHNLYIGAVRSFTLRASYSHDAAIGHLVKSRAATNYILYNRLTDEAGTASYEIDLPNGGTSYVIGNLIQQSATTDNSTIISYGAEGFTHPGTDVYVVHNTFVNSRGSGTFVRVAAGGTGTLVNNLLVGGGTVLSGAGSEAGDLVTDAPGFLDAAAYDYRLTAGSPAVDLGVAPGTAGGYDLAPAWQYAHPAAVAPRAPAGAALDVGAYEVGAGGAADAGASPPADAGPAADASGAAPDAGQPGGGAADGGCGCATARPALPRRGAPLVLALASIVLAGRRRDAIRGATAPKGASRPPTPGEPDGHSRPLFP